MTGSFIDLVRAGGPLEAFGYSAGELAELLRTCADLLPVDVAVALEASLGEEVVPGHSFVELVAGAPLAPPSSPELGHPADWHDAWPPAPLGHHVADLTDPASPAASGDGPPAPLAGHHVTYDDDFGHGARSGDPHDREPSDAPPLAGDVVAPFQEHGQPEHDVRPHGLDPIHDVHDAADGGDDHHVAPWWDEDVPG